MSNIKKSNFICRNNANVTRESLCICNYPCQKCRGETVEKQAVAVYNSFVEKC